MKAYTVIFLCDGIPPTRIVLLHRGKDRAFAPNRYTGIGGKIEEGETPLDGAIRELKEETGIVNVPLTEFGCVVLNNGQVLHYFAGDDTQTALPECNEGTLERVNLERIFSYDIIPTTKVFLEEWEKRAWDTKRQFSVFIAREQPDSIDSAIREVRVAEGLGVA